MQRRLLLSLALSLAAAGLSTQVVAQTPAVLRVTAIPDE